MRNFLRLLLLALRDEARTFAHTPAVVVVVVGGVVLYGILYNLLYKPNIVREVPVVVIDECHDHLSHTFIELLDASPSVAIVQTSTNIEEGKKMLSTRRAEALIFIPRDLQSRIGRGERGVFVDLSSCSSLLFYEATAGATLEAMLSLNEMLRRQMVWMLPIRAQIEVFNHQSIKTEGIALFNPTKGYGDYLLPIVLVVIIAQTLLMAVTIAFGTRKAKRQTLLHIHHSRWWQRTATAMGRSTFHGVLYGLLSLFLVGLLPRLFSLPHLACAPTIAAILAPLILSTSLLGQALGRLFGDGEAPLLVITFFSVGLIFLGGISYPLESMPTVWRFLHYALPAPASILAFVKVEAMGATLHAVAPQLIALWLQSAFYLFLATLPQRDKKTAPQRGCHLGLED